MGAGGPSGRQTLAVSITTRDSADRLATLIAHARAYADEILVAVDEGSSDDTLGVATAHADRILRFRHSGEVSPARVLAHERATTDWVLELDDDEAMDAAFPAVLPDLLGSAEHNHWWLPRKLLVPGESPHWADGPAWFPDWQLRLVRADPSIIWKPIGAHTGRRIVGRGGRDGRAAILHHERLLIGDEARAAKVDWYRRRGADPVSESYYGDLSAASLRPLEHGPVPPLEPAPPGRGLVEAEVIDLDRRSRLPPWGAELRLLSAPPAPVAGTTVTFRVEARNTGGLRWSTHDGAPQQWPIINLVCRALAPDGGVLDATAARFAAPRVTRPGETVEFLCPVALPADSDAVVLQWEMVSENEIWFADAGAEPLRTTISLAADPARAARGAPGS